MPLTNKHMTDRELLIAIKQATGNDGWVAADELAYDLGFIDDGKGQPQKVTSRCGYMVRQGWLDRDRPQSGYVAYRLTDLGRAITQGRMSKGLQRALNTAHVGDQVLAMREITKQSFDSALSATAVRREFEHAKANRRY